MFIPIPFAFPIQLGPPTECATRLRPWFILVCFLQFAVSILRFWPVLDIMGGFIMVCTTCIGYYAAQQDMNVQYMCYYGIMCFINGIFDLVKCIDWMVKVSGMMPIFSSKMSMTHNVMSFTMIACPVVSLIG